MKDRQLDRYIQKEIYTYLKIDRYWFKSKFDFTFTLAEFSGCKSK